VSGTQSDLSLFLFAGPSEDPDKYRLLGTPRGGGEAYVWRASTRTLDPTRRHYALRMVRPVHLTRGVHTNELLLEKLTDSRQRNAHIHHAAFVLDFDFFTGPPPHAPGAAGQPDAWHDLHADDQPAVLIAALGGRNHPDLTPEGLMRRVYAVSAWVDGVTLSEFVDEASGPDAARQPGPREGGHARGNQTTAASGVPTERVTQILTDLSAAVDSLAQVGLYHGDLSPNNVMITSDGAVRIIDTAGIREVPGEESVLMGTPAYAAPDGEKSRAWDRYSVGSLAYYLLTGSAVSRDRPTRSAAQRLSAAGYEQGIVDLVVAALEPSRETRVNELGSWAEDLTGLLLLHPSRRIGRRDAGPYRLGQGPVSRYSGGTVLHYVAHGGDAFVIDTGGSDVRLHLAPDTPPDDVVPPRMAPMDDAAGLSGTSYAGDLRWTVDSDLMSIRVRTLDPRFASSWPEDGTDAAGSAYAAEPIVGVLDVVLDDFDEPVSLVRGASGQPWGLVPLDEPERLPWPAVAAARLAFDADGRMVCFAVTATGVRAAVRDGLSWVEQPFDVPGAYLDVAPVLSGAGFVIALASLTGPVLVTADSLGGPPVAVRTLGTKPCAAVSALPDQRGRVQVAFADAYAFALLTTTITPKPGGSPAVTALTSHALGRR
jgi:serine/threonine protein kinase